MRKLVVLTFVSLDGVMQAPGGAEEDPSENFSLGGWTVPYFDDAAGEEMGKQMSMPFDLLLGRKTYDLFASYWPKQENADKSPADPFNKATKYVVSHGTPELPWEKSVLITGDVPAVLRELKAGDGPMLQVHGSANLIQTLMNEDLVDELWLKTFPVILGSGKRLFEGGAVPRAYELTESSVTPKGVVLARYKRAGEVETGSFS